MPLQVSACLSFVKQENIAYPACTLQYNGKQCNKKVTDNGGGDGPNRWFCERCNANCEAEFRYMLSIQIEDHSGKEWVTAFQVCTWPALSLPDREQPMRAFLLSLVRSNLLYWPFLPEACCDHLQSRCSRVCYRVLLRISCV